MSSPKRISKPGHLYRTALFIAQLKKRSGLGMDRLCRQIAENQYVAFGLTPPSPKTTREYFLLRQSPAIDPPSVDSPAWLMAAEQEFPGSSFYFFHPLFDFLFHQIESNIKWKARLGRYPETWIEQARRNNQKELVKEWSQYNESLTPKRGRPVNQVNIDRLRFIHLTLMRLPEPYFGRLFRAGGLVRTIARRHLPMEDEINFLAGRPGIDALSCLTGLLLEAAEISNLQRLQASRNALQGNLDAFGIPELKTKEADGLRFFISDLCLNILPRSYSFTDFQLYGLPSTWQAMKVADWLEEEVQRI